jgi:hypothetical protein
MQHYADDPDRQEQLFRELTAKLRQQILPK